MKKLNIYYAEPDINALERLAKQQGVSFAEVVRQAIRFFLDAKKV